MLASDDDLFTQGTNRAACSTRRRWHFLLRGASVQRLWATNWLLWCRESTSCSLSKSISGAGWTSGLSVFFGHRSSCNQCTSDLGTRTPPVIPLRERIAISRYSPHPAIAADG